jgi:hypothetical protein
MCPNRIQHSVGAHLRCWALTGVVCSARAQPIAPRVVFRACSVPELLVSAGCLFGVDVGWRDEPRDAGLHVDGPLFFVDEVVVV